MSKKPTHPNTGDLRSATPAYQTETTSPEKTLPPSGAVADSTSLYSTNAARQRTSTDRPPEGTRAPSFPPAAAARQQDDKERNVYARRIDELRGYGELDGVQIDDDSERDFWSFVPSAPTNNKAQLVLMDNGNLRAVWRNSGSNHIGIQFLGRDLVEYVIFKRREDSEDISRVSGIDTLEGVKRQIHAFDLTSLVYA